MGTHLDKNGYYIWAKWVPISHAIGYPFLDYIVLFGTKYSGDIKITDHHKVKSMNISIFQFLQEIYFAQQRILICYACKPKMRMRCFIANVKSRFVAKALLYHCNSVAIQLQRQWNPSSGTTELWSLTTTPGKKMRNIVRVSYTGIQIPPL